VDVSKATTEFKTLFETVLSMCGVVGCRHGADTDDDELLCGLTGQARSGRAELIRWLLAHDFDAEQIRGALIPMLLPAQRVVGDDGTYVSAQQIGDAAGIDVELLARLQQSLGLPRMDDPTAAVQSRADAESVVRSKALIDFGFDVDEVVGILRVLVEAVNFTERSSGSLPGAREMTVAFADLVGFTELGEMVAPEELERVANRLAELARDVMVIPVRFVKTIGDAVMFVSSR
jgi:adenylate cyclase